MNKVDENLVELIRDYSIGSKSFWKLKFNKVLDEVKYFHADNIVSYYFNNKDVRYKDIYIDIMNFCFGLEDNKFKQYMVKNTLHILKCNNHHFYDVIEYHLLYDL